MTENKNKTTQSSYLSGPWKEDLFKDQLELGLRVGTGGTVHLYKPEWQSDVSSSDLQGSGFKVQAQVWALVTGIQYNHR